MRFFPLLQTPNEERKSLHLDQSIINEATNAGEDRGTVNFRFLRCEKEIPLPCWNEGGSVHNFTRSQNFPEQETDSIFLKQGCGKNKSSPPAAADPAHILRQLLRVSVLGTHTATLKLQLSQLDSFKSKIVKRGIQRHTCTLLFSRAAIVVQLKHLDS